MKNPEKVVQCALCTAVRAFTHCLGCGIPICENCAREVEQKSDPDCVWSLCYCPMCIDDPAVNPDATRRIGEA